MKITLSNGIGPANKIAKLQTINKPFLEVLTVHHRRALIGYTMTKNLRCKY